MPCFSSSRLSDRVLLRTLATVVTRDRETTAELLALMAEVDKRQLFRGEGYPSMFRYCVEKLRMSEDVAYKRIQTARATRRFPAILPAIADGRLHLTAVVLLKPFLTIENAEGVLIAAAGKTKAQVELLIAERFPRADVPTSIRAIGPIAMASNTNELLGHGISSASAAPSLLAPASTEPAAGAVSVQEMSCKLVPEPVPHERTTQDWAPAFPPVPERRVAPLSPGRFELRLTMSQQLHDKLRYAQELLGHAVPCGAVAQVLERALDELIAKQEKSKFAATEKPRAARGSRNPRYISALVKREVWNRDQGRCTYVSAEGHRCDARELLEYDHVEPVARGGTATVNGLRLRCRAHNQLEAERTFGAGFMEAKRAAVSRAH